MPFQRPPRSLSVLASALALAGIGLAAAGCSGVAPLGPGAASPSLPPVGQLRSPITVQVMRSQSPTSSGRCPGGSVDLVGLEPGVPRLIRSVMRVSLPIQPGSPRFKDVKATPSPPPRPTPPAAHAAGVACYRPAGKPVTITSAAVSSVTTYQSPQRTPKEPGTYGFVVAFPPADVAALTALASQAYKSGAATGISVAGQLWQAPQIRRKLIALRGIQVNLFSRKQAVRLYRLLVASG
jgi:hypothetical protein